MMQLSSRYALGIGFKNQFTEFILFYFIFGFAKLHELGTSSCKHGSTMKAL